MPVPTNISQLSTTAGENSPLGSEPPSILDDIQRAHAAFIAQLHAARELPGVVKHYAGATAPAGWLVCAGQAVSRTEYSALFAAIGTTWGAGDGTTTFNLPPADRMLVGAGGLYSVGATGGSRDAIVVSHTHTATTGNQSADHTHSGTTSTNGDHAHLQTQTPSGFSGSGTNIIGGANGAGNMNDAAQSTRNAGSHSHTFTTGTASADHTHAVTVTSTGSSGTNANLPPYAAMLLIIKT